MALPWQGGGNPWGRRPLPDAPYSVGSENVFVADNGDVLGLGLGYEHAVEGVLVRTGQQARADGMIGGDRQQLEALAFQAAGEIGGQIGGGGQPAEADLGGDLSGGGGADDHRVFRVGNDSTGEPRESGIIRKPPQESMSIEQRAQGGLFPAREFAGGKGLKEFGANAQLAFERPGPTLALNLPDRDEASDRF